MCLDDSIPVVRNKDLQSCQKKSVTAGPSHSGFVPNTATSRL